MTEEIKNGDGFIICDLLYKCPSCKKRLCDNFYDDKEVSYPNKNSVDWNDGKRWCKFCGEPHQLIVKAVPGTTEKHSQMSELLKAAQGQLVKSSACKEVSK